MIKTQTITAATTLSKPDNIFDNRARYQVECHNATATGTATVEVNFGAGYRLMKTIDLTDVARAPFTIEADIVAIKVTPSQEMTLALSSERA